MDSAPESDGDAAVAGMDGEMESSTKRRKKEGLRRENEEEELRRVAEIVLVLSAMGRMRGGRNPTSAEKVMMSEARKKVVGLCEELAPKDILPREAFVAVIEDLGLNKEQWLGFRVPKRSIADKLAHTKRRMEESKAFATQPAPYPSQRLQNTGAAGQNCGTPSNVHVLSSDKAGHVPVSAGSFQPRTPVVHVSSAPSAPLQFRPPGSEVRPPMVYSPVPNNTRIVSPSTVPHKVDRAHIRSDGRPDGASLVPHIPVGSSSDQHMVRSSLVPLQPQPTPLVNVGTKNKVPNHLSVRADGNAALSASQRTAPIAVGQSSKPAVSQTAPITPPTVHHPMRSTQFVRTSPVNHHLGISKLVQKLLYQKLPKHCAWTPPSRDYMTRAVMCPFCKLSISEVENVLVCDACEKGYHLGCLQSYNAKGIPRDEWHCPRCLALSHGKPFPPKYGRVTRNMNAPRPPSHTIGVQLSSEKKVETVDVNQNQPSPMTNGNPGSKAHPLAGEVTESSSEPNLQHGNEINKSSMLRIKNNNEPISDTVGTSDQLAASTNQNHVDQERLPNGGEVNVHQHGSCNGFVECNKHYDDKIYEKAAELENLLAGEKVHDQARDAELSENALHNVDWIGDIDRVVDEKKFFRSCCINGAVYKMQDYALFHPGNGKLIPVKLQAMWEDNQTSSKWLLVHKCYFPDDLPQEVGRPGAPQSYEVYESTHDSNVMAGFIQGPCEVLPYRKFGEDMGINNQDSQENDRKRPVFIRNWFYDESRRAFCPSAS